MMARPWVPGALAVFMVATTGRAEGVPVMGAAPAPDPAKSDAAGRLPRALEIADAQGPAFGDCTGVLATPQALAGTGWFAEWLGIHDPMAPWSPEAGAVSSWMGGDGPAALPRSASRLPALYAAVRDPGPTRFGTAGRLAAVLPGFLGWTTALSVTFTYASLELAAWLSCRFRKSRAARQPGARRQTRPSGLRRSAIR